VKTIYQEKAAEYLAFTERWGFKPEILQRIGAFLILCGLFETKVEVAVWSLRDEDVGNRRHSTDGSSIGEMIDALGKGSAKLNGGVRDLLNKTAATARDLGEYRRALIHGHIIPSYEMPSLFTEPTVARRGPEAEKREAFVTENLLNMAIDSAGILCRVVLATPTVGHSATDIKRLLALECDVSRAKSQAHELRRLAAMANDQPN
jgi:hypothetical protein